MYTKADRNQQAVDTMPIAFYLFDQILGGEIMAKAIVIGGAEYCAAAISAAKAGGGRLLY